MPGARAIRTTQRPARGVIVACALACVLAMVAVPAATDAAVEDIDEQVEQAQERAAAAQAALDALGADLVAARDELVAIQRSLDDATARLRTFDGQLTLASEELEALEEQAAVAAADAVAAAAELERVGRELEVESQLLRDQQALTWIHGPSTGPQMVLELLEQSQTPGNLAADLYSLEVMLDTQAGVVGRVDGLRTEQEAATVDAIAARAQADESAANAAHTVSLVAGLRNDAAALRRSAAEDRERQTSLLSALEADAGRNAAVLDAVDDELARLAAERAEATRKRELTEGACPVEGAVVGRDFSNDWSHPRSGGRSHEGTDIFADRGTPVLAIGDGSVKEVRYDDSGLGGRFVSIWTGRGEHWYYAHLESVAAGIAVGVPVSEGQLLGTVGDSGNAQGTPPHLHIGHYFNDVAENPYPVLEVRCQ